MSSMYSISDLQYHLLFILNTCSVPFFKTDQFTSHAMELVYFVNLIFIFVVNILFFFSGICLNSLVIVSFWRSVQLRKKLCYFTIMILSCCDLLVVLTSHPSTALTAMLWLTKMFNVYPGWLVILLDLSNICIFSSLLALLVMSVDRYLATHYPLFHRTSVTKGKLLTLFIFLFFITITVMAISKNDLVVPYQVGLLIFGILRLTSKDRKDTLNNAGLAGFWSATTAAINSTFNCLIFYWKNKTLRAEGMKVIRSIKICRRSQSFPGHPEQSENNGR